MAVKITLIFGVTPDDIFYKYFVKYIVRAKRPKKITVTSYIISTIIDR